MANEPAVPAAPVQQAAPVIDLEKQYVLRINRVVTQGLRGTIIMRPEDEHVVSGKFLDALAKGEYADAIRDYVVKEY